MRDLRNTGGNRLSRNGQRLDIRGRRDDGHKEMIVTRVDISKGDEYWGGLGKPDGSGHDIRRLTSRPGRETVASLCG